MKNAHFQNMDFLASRWQSRGQRFVREVFAAQQRFCGSRSRAQPANHTVCGFCYLFQTRFTLGKSGQFPIFQGKQPSVHNDDISV